MPRQPPQLNNRLKELLRRARIRDANRQISLRALELYIHQKDPKSRKAKIDHRQLKRLLDGDETVTLSMQQLRALNIYLLDHGLIKLNENPLFCPPHSLLDALVDETKLTLFYPVRFLEPIGTEVASHWDLLAIAALLATPQIANLAVSLQDVFHFGKAHEGPHTAIHKQREEPWYAALNSEEALLSFGSPFVSYSTERMLCRMFGLNPFEAVGYSSNNPLPFYLYWPEEDKMSESAFSITREELDRSYPHEAAKIGRKDRALLTNGRLYLAHSRGTSVNLLLAQYWNGHIILVVMGIFAPATFAIAECIANGKIEQAPPPYANSLSGDATDAYAPVQMTLIETLIEKPQPATHGVARDNRKLRSDETKVIASQLWEQTGNNWNPR